MNKPIVAAVFMAVPLLTACATNRYWYESPPVGLQASPTLAGDWQGLARHDYVQRFSFGTLAGHVSIRCARYQDIIRLDVEGGQIEAALGSSPTYRFTTTISPGGQFSHQMPVQGDTWIYGGVGIYSNEPTLTVSGTLDPYSGIGHGTIAATPGENERLGCYGRFQVSRNAGPPRPSEQGEPFKIQYWINRVDDGDNDKIWLMR